MTNETTKPLVGIIMGSSSDWETMRHTADQLKNFGVPHVCRVMSAHRTPEVVEQFSRSAEADGMEVIIAAAGGAAHLAGVVAAYTTVPVLAVPIESVLKGIDSLLSMVQMPGGIPVATFAIGKAGATNAALFAISVLAGSRPEYREKLHEFRRQQAKKVLEAKLPE